MPPPPPPPPPAAVRPLRLATPCLHLLQFLPSPTACAAAAMPTTRADASRAGPFALFEALLRGDGATALRLYLPGDIVRRVLALAVAD